MSPAPAHRTRARRTVRNPLGRPRRSPWAMALHWVLTLGLLAAVAWLLLRNEAGFEDVGSALAQVGPIEVAVLLVLTALIQVTFGWEYAAGLRGLGLTRGLVLFEGQTAVSNLIPGPSGTATRLMMLRSWGFSLDDFSRLWLVTSGVTDLLVLAMPVVAVAGAAAVGDAESGTAWGIAAAGVVVGAVLALLAVLALRSERLAARLGAVSGRVITWARGIARRAGEGGARSHRWRLSTAPRSTIGRGDV